MRTPAALLLVPLLVLHLGGCGTLALTAAGIGGSAALNHTLNGMPYRTFTAPSAQVKTASISALRRMGMKLAGSHKGEGGIEYVRATATERDIEVTLEPLSASSTRMQVVARNGGFLYDGATANEIIAQTERQLGPKVTSR